MLEIPIQPTPSQVVKVVLSSQNFQILLQQKDQGIFVDINVNGTDVSTGTVARDGVPLISQDYAGVAGNVLFVDTQGYSDPNYADLGTRYVLLYLTADEYLQLQQ